LWKKQISMIINNSSTSINQKHPKYLFTWFDVNLFYCRWFNVTRNINSTYIVYRKQFHFFLISRLWFWYFQRKKTWFKTQFWLSLSKKKSSMLSKWIKTLVYHQKYIAQTLSIKFEITKQKGIIVNEQKKKRSRMPTPR